MERRPVEQGLPPGERVWRRLRWALLLLAIAGQGLHQYAFGSLRYGYFNFDKGFQIAAAQALLDGHGLSTLRVSPDHPAEPLRLPLAGWPPGYSLAVAALLAWRNDVWTACLVVDLVSIAIFFVAWFAIFQKLAAQIAGGTKILVWIVWIFVTNPLMPMTSAELLAQALFSAAVYFCVACGETRGTGRLAAAYGVCAGLAAAVRYAYWPLLAVGPVALAAAALVAGRRKPMLVAAAIAAGTSLAVLAPVALFELAPGHQDEFAVRMIAPESGRLLWNQLRAVSPFPAVAIGLSDAWATCAQCCPAVTSLPEYPVAWLVSLPVLVLAIAALVRQRRLLRKAAGEPQRTTLVLFGAAGLLTTLATIALLVYLSLRVPGMSAPLWPGGICTFVNEDRYFAVFFAFLVLAAASSLVAMLARHRAGWLRALALVLLACWLGAGAYTRLWRMGTYLTDSRGGRSLKTVVHRDTRLVWATVRKHVDAGRQVLFIQRETGPNEVGCGRAALMAGACLVPEPLALRVPAEAKAPTALLFMLLPPDVAVPDSPTRKLAENPRSLSLDRLHYGTLYELVLGGKPDPPGRAEGGRR